MHTHTTTMKTRNHQAGTRMGPEANQHHHNGDNRICPVVKRLELGLVSMA
jgi:hypothetical protein